MTKQFDGRISIVTGAGSGIGFATAEGLAAGGATVICVDWKGAEEAAASIRSSGGNATGVMLDVRDSAGWTALIADVVARHGPIDILVNNAGIAVPGDTAADVSEEVWDRILDINAKGVWLGMRSVLPGMVARKRGKICNVASTARPHRSARRRGLLRIEGGGARAHAPSRRAICAVQYPDQFGVARHDNDRAATRCHRGPARGFPAADADRPVRRIPGGRSRNPVSGVERFLLHHRCRCQR